MEKLGPKIEIKWDPIKKAQSKRFYQAELEDKCDLFYFFLECVFI